MHTLTRMLATCFVLVMAAALSACAGTDVVDKQDYIKQNNEIQTKAASAISGINTSDPKAIDETRKALDGVVADFNELDVPADYKEEHADMVAALEEMGAIMGDLKKAVANEDIAAANKIITRMSASETKFNGAIDAMNADLA